MIGDRFSVDWVENSGPPVTAPERSGFGTKLLASALVAFEGQVQIDYLAAGLHCVINCKMPTD
jgi:two-component sensor histidine kinase